MNITWDDKHNTPYAGTLNLTSLSGSKDKRVGAFDGENTGLDRETTLELETLDSVKTVSVKIKQTGKRDTFNLSDGSVLKTSDGSTFNVLKTGNHSGGEP